MKFFDFLKRLKCKIYGHDFYWYYLGFLGDGRKCRRCNFRQTLDDYKKGIEDGD